MCRLCLAAHRGIGLNHRSITVSGNTFGKAFTLTTYGESHGESIGCIVDGCPPGISLSAEDIQPDLDRRKPGTSRYTTQRRESDLVEIHSGVFQGRTTGTPIGLIIRNTDQRSKDYSNIADRYRPGHADYAYARKYGIRDYRGGGRSSARETALRVAAGAIAKKYLRESFGTQIRGYVSQIGEATPEGFDWNEVESNPFFWPCQSQVSELEDMIKSLRRLGDSTGAQVTAVATQVPSGWGEPVYSRLDADIAGAMMGINAVKGVEIGAGFDCVGMLGSQYRDEMTPHGFLSNNGGGVAGGISTGQPVSVSVAFKPTSSIVLPGRTVSEDGSAVHISVTGRHDPCVGIRAVPIVEAMLALVLVDHALRHRGQNADVESAAPQIPAEAENPQDLDPVVDQSSFKASGED